MGTIPNMTVTVDEVIHYRLEPGTADLGNVRLTRLASGRNVTTVSIRPEAFQKIGHALLEAAEDPLTEHALAEVTGERDRLQRRTELLADRLEQTQETLAEVRNAHTETRGALSEAAEASRLDAERRRELIEQRDAARLELVQANRETEEALEAYSAEQDRRDLRERELEADCDEARREVIEKMQEAASWEVLCLEKDEHLAAVRAHLDDVRAWLHATTRPNLVSVPEDDPVGDPERIAFTPQGVWIGSGDPDDQHQACVVDRDGDLWRRQDDGLWFSHALRRRAWDVLLATYGPLYSASVGQAAITDEPR